MNQYDFLCQGVPLANYKSNALKPLFKDADSDIPQFLKENLVDDQRVIKQFKNDPQSHLRVFYYQYLKLCFEMEQTDFQMYIRKIEELLANQDFKFVFPSEKRGQLYKDLQFKRFLIEFMEVLDGQDANVDAALTQYPIMDEVLVSLFRSILISNEKCIGYDDPINREQLFEFLASYFCIDIALYENCLKFIDSDVFLYQESESQLYMIYIDYKDKQLKNINQIDQYLMQPVSDGNISSVRQMISNVNLSEINSDLQISKEEKKIEKQQKRNDEPIKIEQKIGETDQNQGSQVGEFIDYTYSKNSDQKICFTKDRQSFKFSLNQGSYVDFQNLGLKDNGINNRAILTNQGSSHCIKSKYSNDNHILTPIVQAEDNFVSTLKNTNQEKRRGSHLVLNKNTQSAIESNHQHSNSVNQRCYLIQNENFRASDPQAYRDQIGRVLQSKPINLKHLDQFINKVNEKLITHQKMRYPVECIQRNEKQNYFGRTTESYFNNDCQIPIGGTSQIRMKQSGFSSSIGSDFRKQGSVSGLSTANPGSLLINTGFKNEFEYTKKLTNLQHNQENNSQIIKNDSAIKDSSWKARDYLTNNLINKEKYELPRNSPWKNITKQFTNSYILKQIPDPYKQRISSMKARSRVHRNAINNRI